MLGGKRFERETTFGFNSFDVSLDTSSIVDSKTFRIHTPISLSSNNLDVASDLRFFYFELINQERLFAVLQRIVAVKSGCKPRHRKTSNYGATGKTNEREETKKNKIIEINTLFFLSPDRSASHRGLIEKLQSLIDCTSLNGQAFPDAGVDLTLHRCCWGRELRSR